MLVKRKYNGGKSLAGQILIFGGVTRGKFDESFVELLLIDQVLH